MLLLWRRPRRFVQAYAVVLAVLAVGATADAITTLRNGLEYGPDIELHLAQRLVSEILGVTIGVPLAKLIQLAFVLLVASWWRPWCRWMLLGCGLLYSLAAVSNHFVLL